MKHGKYLLMIIVASLLSLNVIAKVAPKSMGNKLTHEKKIEVEYYDEEPKMEDEAYLEMEFPSEQKEVAYEEAEIPESTTDEELALANSLPEGLPTGDEEQEGVNFRY
ncbi:MAG: hypothetical protein ACOYL6_02425 [Bacteriovoracaceae bacterium]